MVKAIFFDIDGTLVSFNTHSIPESTQNALKQLREKGIKVFIATGRPKVLMMDAVGHLPFDGFITLNGAHCLLPIIRIFIKEEYPKKISNASSIIINNIRKLRSSLYTMMNGLLRMSMKL